MKAILVIFLILLSHLIVCQGVLTFRHHKHINKFEGNKPNLSNIQLFSKDFISTVYLPCVCEKNVKENKIAIQSTKIFPSLSFKSLHLNGTEKPINDFWVNKSINESHKDVGVQMTSITIDINGNKVDSISIERASEEPEFEGKHYTKANIDYYNIHLTKTNYRVASDIWGVAKLKMPIPFGWTDEDYIVHLYFRCNNGKVSRKPLKIPEFDYSHGVPIDDY